MYEAPVEAILRRIAETALSPEDLDQRVRRSMGEEFLPKARAIATQVRGQDWFESGKLQRAEASRRRFGWLSKLRQELAIEVVRHDPAATSSSSGSLNAPPQRSTAAVPVSVPAVRQARIFSIGYAVGRLVTTPSLLVVLIGTAAIAALMLFPPYVVPWRDGVVNAGHASLLTPPVMGDRFIAIVNVPLLLTMMFGVIVVCAGLYFVLRRLEDHVRTHC